MIKKTSLSSESVDEYHDFVVSFLEDKNVALETLDYLENLEISDDIEEDIDDIQDEEESSEQQYYSSEFNLYSGGESPALNFLHSSLLSNEVVLISYTNSENSYYDSHISDLVKNFSN